MVVETPVALYWSYMNGSGYTSGIVLVWNEWYTSGIVLVLN